MKPPLVPTMIVAAAVAVMVALGFWQLQRAEWKKDLIARYERAEALPPIAWPAIPPADPRPLHYRRAAGHCLVVGWRATAGRNVRNEPGWSHIAACRTGAGGPMQVDAGWSRSSASPPWRGGPVDGVIVPDSRHGMRLVAATPAPGLQPSMPPSPETIPDNHLLYAIQWFFFAAAAVAIYFLALRRRRAQAPPTGGPGRP